MIRPEEDAETPARVQHLAGSTERPSGQQASTQIGAHPGLAAASSCSSQLAAAAAKSNRKCHQHKLGEPDPAEPPRQEVKHPLDAANLISLLTFGWMLPFFWKAWRRGLRLADAPTMPSESESCHRIFARLVACWARELAALDATSSAEPSKAQVRHPPRSTNKPNKASLLRALLWAQADSVFLGLLLTLTSECVCKTLSAYSVGQVLKLMSSREARGGSTTGLGEWSFSEPLCVWTLVLVLSCFSHVIIAHFYGFHMMRLGLRAKTGCSYLIYTKALRLGQQESIQKTMGRVINLISNDLEKLVMVAILAPFLVVGPLQTLISLYLLWPSLGYSCLGSVLAICTLTPIQIYLNFKYGHLRKTISAYADERVRKVNEIIMALKLIKLYGWEYSLRDALMEVRKRETDLIKRESLIKGISNAFICVSTKLVLFVTIITHCLVLGQTLNTHTLFVSMAMLNNLHITMNMIVPRAISMSVEAWIGCHRVQEFLLQPDYKRFELEQKSPMKALPQLGKTLKTSRVYVEYMGVQASWMDSPQKTLDNVSFNCQAPELIVVCGQVASGKSSLLLSLIGELPVERGHISVGGTSAYCSQRAWTFDGSIRDNIVFGRAFDEKRYEQVVDICALRRDLQLLMAGDLTYIQENTLSGGQKARVNLARCVYGEHDIYLLDDPLSALDSRVARQIFEETIKKFLKGKLVIMSSHQIGIIKQSDKLLLLDQGKQLAFCSFDKLCDKVYYDDEFRRGSSTETLSWIRSLTVGSGVSNEEAAATTCDGDNGSENLSNCGTPAAAGGAEQTGKLNHETSEQKQNLATHQLKNCERKNSAPQKEADIGSGLSTGNGAGQDGGRRGAGCHCGSVGQHAPYGTSSSSTNEDKTLIIAPDQKQENSTHFSHGCHSKAPPSDGSKRPEVKVSADKNEDVETTTTPPRGTSASDGFFVNKVNLISDAPQSQSTNYRTGLDESRAEGYRAGGAPSESHKACCSELDGVGGSGQQHSPPPMTQQQQDGRPAGEDAASDRSPGLRIWFQYYTRTSVLTFVSVVLTFLISQALMCSVDIYLTVWSNLEQRGNLIKEIRLANQLQVDDFQHLINISYRVTAKNNNNSNRRIPYDTPALLSTPPITTTTNTSYPPVPVVTRFNDQPAGVVGQIKTSAAHQVVPIASGSPLSLPSFHWRASQPPLAENNNSPPLVDSTDSLVYGGNHHNCTGAYTSGNSTGSLCRNTGSSSSAGLNNTPARRRPCARPPVPDFSDVQSLLTHSTTSPVYEDAPPIEGAHEPPVAVVVVDENILAQSMQADNISPIYRPLYLLVNRLNREQHATVYAVLLIVLFLFSLTTSTLFLRMLNNSSIDLFKNLINSALFSKIAFFDQNPVGRFLNRATYDIGLMDALIPLTALNAYEAILMTMGSLIVVACVDLVLCLPSLAVLSLIMMFHSVHIVSIKEIKRLESISRSPIISHISSSLEGVQTIRSNRAEDRFSGAFQQHLNFHTSIYLLYIGANRFLAVFIDSINCSYVGVIAVWAVVSGMDGASAGLAITSALLLSGVTQNGIMKWTDAESAMTSVERVIEYCNLPQEDYNHHHNDERSTRKSKRQRKLAKRQHKPSDSSGLPNTAWLKQGRVEYESVDLYYTKTGKPVLKNISFKLEPGEKVAIVGRTGAGKSSIISTLFRLYDYNGRILIDGHDIKEINLIELRKSIGIIPQSPVLLSDSIRKNLDPTNVYDDFSMWNALDKAHLRATVSALPGKLDCVIGDGSGGSFSSGQKQLICLARVLLRKCKVVVMDEATANVDPATDAIIQSTIRHEFKHSTVITIAHRIQTIVDYNRIIVLDAGRIVDFDTPEQLAIKSNSYISDQLRKHMKK